MTYTAAMVRFAIALLCCVAIAGAQEPAKPKTFPETKLVPATIASKVTLDLETCPHPSVLALTSTVISLDVTAGGMPEAVRVGHSSGDVCMDQMAVAAVRQYRFRPATWNGQPVLSHLTVSVER